MSSPALLQQCNTLLELMLHKLTKVSNMLVFCELIVSKLNLKQKFLVLLSGLYENLAAAEAYMGTVWIVSM